MYEYVDLMLIAINLLFCGLLLHRSNKTTEKLEKLENLTITNIKNPKISRKLLNEYNK
tara:strand:+ start:254 stop:427 length:174 start_codon:yes stop_codon:yes gene_type:complete